MFLVDHCHDVQLLVYELPLVINVAKLLAPTIGLCHEF